MSDKNDDLTHYLSELYKNLNLITADIFEIEDPEIEMDSALLTKTMENQFSEWMGSFYNILVYLFCTVIAFFTSIINLDYRILAIVMFGVFPIYLWFTFLYSIPEVRVNNKIIFSRKDLTLTKQLQLGKSLFVFFLRQLYQNSKIGILISIGFLAFLGWNILQLYL